MTRLIYGLALAAAIGCTGIQPVGPMAGKKGMTPDPKAEPPDPVTIPAPTPPPPKCIVHADDVTAENADTIKKQLPGGNRCRPQEHAVAAGHIRNHASTTVGPPSFVCASGKPT